MDNTLILTGMYLSKWQDVRDTWKYRHTLYYIDNYKRWIQISFNLHVYSVRFYVRIKISFHNKYQCQNL